MASSTTTAIELEQRRPTATHRELPNSSDRGSSDLDPVLQASQQADSEVPDGGYGWVVVMSCAILSWWVIGTSYSWGVIQGALVEGGLSTPATLSFVGSLGPTLLGGIAILNSRIMRAIGARNTILLGISLVGVAEILSSFTVKSLPGLFTTSSTPAQYFSRKRGLANGVVFAGGGLGGAIRSLCSGLFKDLRFVLIVLAGAVGTFPLFVPPFFVPLYARSLGLSSGTGAGLLAGFNFASAIGRIICGILCDVIGPLNSLFPSLCVCGISMLVVWPVSQSLAPLAIFVIVNGLANGGFFSTMPTVVGNVFGSARVSVAMRMVVTSWAGGYLMGAPIAGYLLDAYGGTEAGYVLCRFYGACCCRARGRGSSPDGP
ncbi:hypothetical protein DL764_009666 [Monosporascus ibericus]|uniref:Major facilitator superfamily (MFS) profile domain-containing protein n=1 Tax=Monosporascus ibericus TaxID=155417 RepID=A0A4Q4SUE0_9PEZI|nr:hypothetical protein DL764_009666 [Monosporascus ibericus]